MITFKILFLLSLFNVALLAYGFELNNEQVKQLQKQKYIVDVSIQDKSGMIIFDVDKDIDILMKDILNIDAYPEKIEDVSKVNIYSFNENEVRAKINIDTFFISFHNYVIHDIDLQDYAVYWHLDKEKENYFSKMQGYWKFKQLGNKTRVIYYNKLEFKSWIPSFIESYLLKEALFKSTQWIKN